MASISAPGLGSGLDITSIVTQLVAAERRPTEVRLDRQEAELQARLSAFGTLRSAVSSLRNSLSSLNTLSTYQGRTANSSDADVLSASATTTAAPGNFDVSVTQLAKSHKLATDPSLANAQFTSATDVIGTGTLTFKFGTTDYVKSPESYNDFTQNAAKVSQTVEITDGSLTGIRDAVNDADIGVTASIVFDGSYHRLVFTADDTGAANSLQITVNDADSDNADSSGLSLLTFNATANHLEQTDAAQDATLTINGIGLTSASNTVDDAIEGLSLDLAQTGNATVTVGKNTAAVSSAINAFVAAYNGFIQTGNDLGRFNAETGEAGLLNGDAVLRGITAQVRRVVSTPVDGVAGALSTLADLGITTSSSDGTLVLDNGALSQALADNFEDVASVFAAASTTTDSLVRFQSSSEQTVPGTYAVNITKLASQGELVGAQAANLTITEDSNDTINVTVDGTSAAVTLTAGTYSAAGLAAEVQSQINAASEFQDADIAVTVTHSGGVLTITSNRYGSASNVSINSGNGKTDLVGSSPTTTVGEDVAGQIGGVTATGSGKVLTGSGAAQGLKLEINGNTVGDRGTATFTRGFADQLDDLLGSILANDAVLDSVTDGIDARIDDIADARRVLDRRMDSLEQRLFAQFSALDVLVSQLNTTGAFLSQQLANLPQIGRSGS